MRPVLRFSERNYVGIHLASLDFDTFEPAESSVVEDPHLMSIYTQFHAANHSTNVLRCHYHYTKRITKFNTLQNKEADNEL